MKRGLIVSVLAVGLIALTGCDDGISQNDLEQQRFEQCLDKGGAYWTDGGVGSDWGCNLPNVADGSGRDS